jgi:hypothetical protein
MNNVETSKIHEAKSDFYKKTKIATYKEGSVNDISSASSFSGNKSPRRLEGKKNVFAKHSNQDDIETPRGSINDKEESSKVHQTSLKKENAGKLGSPPDNSSAASQDVKTDQTQGKT